MHTSTIDRNTHPATAAIFGDPAHLAIATSPISDAWGRMLAECRNAETAHEDMSLFVEKPLEEIDDDIELFRRFNVYNRLLVVFLMLFDARDKYMSNLTSNIRDVYGASTITKFRELGLIEYSVDPLGYRSYRFTERGVNCVRYLQQHTQVH